MCIWSLMAFQLLSRHFTNVNLSLTLQEMSIQAIDKVIGIHLLGSLTVCTKLYGTSV